MSVGVTTDQKQKNKKTKKTNKNFCFKRYSKFSLHIISHLQIFQL